jgi:S1-C subfamily serine protease
LKNRILASVILCLCGLPLHAAKRSKPRTLAERFQKLACAVVQIIQSNGAGTGFFVSAEGDIITAAHVGLSRQFSEPMPNMVGLTIDYAPSIRFFQNGHELKGSTLPKLTKDDVIRATSDLIVLHTGIRAPCFLTVREDDSEHVGEHVISIGFPISAPSGALYEGFVSARYPHLAIPLAHINGKPLYPTYDVIRVQMPITPGVSGAPIIADDDTVLGVVTEQPMTWFNDVNLLINAERSATQDFSAHGVDLAKILAEFAVSVQEYESPGAGLAVPTSYLKATVPRAMTPSMPAQASPAAAPHPQ